MTLERYSSILLKRWKLVMLCVVIVGLSTYIGSRLETPIYQSNVLIRVAISTTSSSADYTSLLASDQLVQTEAQIATSGPILHEVASHYPALTVDQLTSATTSTVKLNTQLFEIDVLDPRPARAADIANDIANTLIKQQVQEIQQDDNLSQQQLQQEMDSTHHDIDATTSKITSLQTQITNMQQMQKAAVSQIAALQIQMNNSQSQLNTLQTRYNQWQTTLAQLQMTEAQNNSFLRVVQPAQPAKSPVQPKVLLNTALGLVAGLFFGLVLIVLIEQSDTHIRTAEELSELLNLPVLGTVWRTNTSKGEQEVLTNPAHNINVESYRILRTNIGFSAISKPVHSLMVTSPMAHDGKSTVAANLAIFMAKAGKSTLLIDADLRRPMQHKNFLLSANNDMAGLSDAIVAFSQSQFLTAGSRDTSRFAGISLNSYMHPVGIPNLRIMPAGSLPPNPPELLDSKAADNLFNAIAKSGIEMIIFDTPPLLGLSDASILLSKVDGTLLVIDTIHATKKTLRQMQALLSQVDSRVLGCVLNKLHHNRKDTAYYYYYHGDDEKSAKNGNHSTFSVPQSSLSSSTWKNGSN